MHFGVGLGCVWGAFRVHLGCILRVFWVHLGCTLGVGLGCTGVLECILRVGAFWGAGCNVGWV